MNPMVKYTLARLGLFVVGLAVLFPFSINLFLKLLIALVISAGASFFLLRGWRDQAAQGIETGLTRRRAEKERLRKALAGENDPPATAD